MAVIGGNLAFGIQWRHFTTSRDSNVDVTSTTSFLYLYLFWQHGIGTIGWKRLHVFHVFRYLHTPRLTRRQKKKSKKIGLESHNNNRSVSCAKSGGYTGYRDSILPILPDLVDIKRNFYEGSTFNFKDKEHLKWLVFSIMHIICLNKYHLPTKAKVQLETF